MSNTKDMNLFMLYGAGPASGILAKSEMMKDIRKAITRGYDRTNLVVQFPEVFDSLVGTDANFESSASTLLRSVELPYVGNTVTKSFALIIVNT